MRVSFGWLGMPAIALFGLATGACSAGTENQGGESSTSAGKFATGSNSGTGGFAACEAIEQKADVKPLFLYILVDKSSSMAGSKWDAAKEGLSTWVSDASAAGIQVGLRFFPRDPDSVPACSSQGYLEPSVPFAPLPGNAQALTDAMNAETPDGFSSPLYPALGGAILKSIEVEQNDATVVAAVLVVTDGKPQGPAPTCGGSNPEDPAAIAALAANGVAFDPPVLTFVVGLPGVDQTIANQIAVGGGTDTAILVGATNVAQEFHDALSKVRGDALPCEYGIPESVNSGEVQLTQVNVAITPNGGDKTVIPQDPTCAGDGWKYNDTNPPTSIILCPATCAALKQDDGAAIQILLGCSTVVK